MPAKITKHIHRMLAKSDLGVVLGIRLNSAYDELRFISFSPVLASTTALVRKREQIFFSAAAAFIFVIPLP